MIINALFQIYLTQADGRPVISNVTNVLVKSYVKFYDTQHGKYRAQTLPDVHYAPPPTGVLEFTVNPPENAYSLHLQVKTFPRFTTTKFNSFTGFA